MSAAPITRTIRSGAVEATALIARIRAVDDMQFGRDDSGQDDGRTVYLKASEEAAAGLFAEAPAGDSPRAAGLPARHCAPDRTKRRAGRSTRIGRWRLYSTSPIG